MVGFYRRYLGVVVTFLPFAWAFLRDRRRFVLFGPGRRVSDEEHRRRARRLRDAMLELGPAFVKVGQVLSTRPDVVPPIYVEELATLQDEVPEDAGGDPFSVLEAELGDEIDLEAVERVAGGSLAFVYTAPYDGERIALKVRRPGLPEIIERDLAVIRRLLPIVTLVAPERHRYSLENVANDFEDVILEELDFEREAVMMAEIRSNVDADEVIVPAVYEELSSERLLAMEFVTGRKVTDEDALSAVDRTPNEMATLLAKTYLRMGLVDGIFHADPHPGNLAVADDGRLIIYDFGMSRRLTQTEQEDLLDIYRALVTRDVDRLLDSLVALEVLEPTVNRTEVRHVLELVIENLEGRSVVTWREIITELMKMLQDFPFRIPPNVMLLIRVGSVGEGVCRQLDPEFDFVGVTREFLVEEGFIESEFRGLLEDVRDDLRTSLPALATAPAQFDRLATRLDRGELVVRTEPADPQPSGARSIGVAVLAGSLFITAAILAFHEEPYEVVALVAAVGTTLLYLLVR
ncbi:ABC1 kinase family protein [Natrarchaeobaculum aegyptiacum]|uniref:ABC transporter n=1 Tax=Natrarchaeobaculum aegyptiacum TaxID=745377 RepID=A0A2Z2HV79_9EURY|nr:AarF/UbiB family protein [Natrarchaeobaculum aegyptiacum]ARS88944.1 ABC transporter [Natrarchaeobaculum aegyptiacum]